MPIAGAAFIAAMLFLGLRFFGFALRDHVAAAAVAACLAGGIVLSRLPPTASGGAARWAVFAGFAVALVLIAPFSFMQGAFGFVAVEPLLFYLPEMRRGDTTALALEFHGRALFFTFAAVAVALTAASWLVSRLRYFPTLLAGAAVMMIGANPFMLYALGWSTTPDAHDLIDPAAEVTTPVITGNPERPLNLVLAYFEGFERSMQGLPSTREAYSDVVARAEGGIDFRGVRQLAGLEYSAAGLVATQCGVPLIPRTLAVRYWSEGPAEHMRREGFMPTLVCLGDVLAERGYETVFVNGSDLSMFSIRAFLQSHGFGEIFELEDFSGLGLDDHVSGWGYDDYALMRIVETKLQRLSESETPFMLSFLTIGTHGPDGVLDASCAEPPPGAPAMPTAVACATDHLERLLDTIDALGLADNTVVAVLSDHLMMENTLQAEFDSLTEPRKNLFFVKGPFLPREIVRDASMLDVYPTLLDILGLAPAEGASGMGQSLLAPGPTLVERLGADTASAAIYRNLELSRHLWRPEAHADRVN